MFGSSWAKICNSIGLFKTIQYFYVDQFSLISCLQDSVKILYFPLALSDSYGPNAY